MRTKTYPMFLVVQTRRKLDEHKQLVEEVIKTYFPEQAMAEAFARSNRDAIFRGPAKYRVA